jgi:hypothetical protein
VKANIPVRLPRPREVASKRSPEFIGLVDEVWQLIEEEVRVPMELELQNVG